MSPGDCGRAGCCWDTRKASHAVPACFYHAGQKPDPAPHPPLHCPGPDSVEAMRAALKVIDCIAWSH